MLFVELFLQTFLDTLALFMICLLLADKTIAFNWHSLYWLISFQVFCILVRLNFIVGEHTIFSGIDFLYYDILPVNTIGTIFVLLLFLLIVNSMFFRKSNIETIQLTISSLVIFMVVRISSLAVIAIFLSDDTFLFTYSVRIITVVIVFVLLKKIPQIHFFAKKNLFVNIITLNSFVALIMIAVSVNFNLNKILQNSLYIVFIFSLIIMINAWLIYEQKKLVKQEKRLEVIEQYLPLRNLFLK